MFFQSKMTSLLMIFSLRTGIFFFKLLLFQNFFLNQVPMLKEQDSELYHTNTCSKRIKFFLNFKFQSQLQISTNTFQVCVQTLLLKKVSTEINIEFFFLFSRYDHSWAHCQKKDNLGQKSDVKRQRQIHVVMPSTREKIWGKINTHVPLLMCTLLGML